MPGRGRKHLQLAGIGFADAWLGLEASAICWNWICRCISWVRKHLQLAGIGFVDAYPGFGSICNLLELDLQMHILGSEASATCWNWICRCLVGVGSIHNLLDMNLQMPITKLILRILQQLRWDCFLCRKRAKCSRGLAEHIVLKYNKASHFFLFFTGNCILLSSAVRS